MKTAAARKNLCTALVLLLILLAAVLAAMHAGERMPEVTVEVSHDTSSGGVRLGKSVEDLSALGFAYGDSVDVVFSNGYILRDIPYYSGYYASVGEPLLMGSPTSSRLKVAICFGRDLWDAAALTEGMTATVSLRTRGSCLDVQEARDIVYSDDRAQFSSDEAFANFRCIRGGTLKDQTVFRSASPCDNKRKRAACTDRLLAQAGVRFVLDLADSDEDILRFMSSTDFDSPCFAGLYRDGKVAALGLDMDFTSAEFAAALAGGLSSMAECEAPYLIQCLEGKDRTGFVCMLIGALAGADYKEIERDFMLTYVNYYGISGEASPEKYDVIVKSILHPMLRTMIGEENVDFTSVPLNGYAESFLKNAGMSAAGIEKLKSRILTDVPTETAA